MILGRDFLRRTIEMTDTDDVLHIQSRRQSVAIAQD